MSEALPTVSHRRHVREPIPGLLLTLILAVLSFTVWWFFKDSWLKFSALLWAFIFSIVAVNLLPVLSGVRFQTGIEFASTRLLRWAIALLGLTVSASMWISLGGIGLVVVLINLTFAFFFGFFFCHYVLKLDSTLSILIGVGTCICGASAIAATGPALKAKAEQMGLSLAVVTLFGLIAMFGYPLLFAGPLAAWLDNNALAYGMWVGTGIHETAQVIAAGSQVDGAVSIAVSAKFIRIFMIGPMVFVSLLMFHRFSGRLSGHEFKLAIPWFAVVFIAFTLVHAGLQSLPIRESWTSFNISYLKPAVTFFLAWSFAAVGLKVKLSTIRAIGIKSFLGGIVVAVVAGGTALLLVKYLWLPFMG